MALVGSFSSRPLAELAASMLSAHGVPAHVAGDDAGGLSPDINFGSGGGYAISVRDSHRERALELLDGDPDPAS
ncbi:MAG TPA: hypothetical protein VK906_04295 [Egicoccus sp.]|nr:hypothetical protein [Egicoccus sp.]HSK22368.1 hypothetical protein [Egicoccus sp.]